MRRPRDPGWAELKDQVRRALWAIARAGTTKGYEKFVVGFREDNGLSSDEISHRSRHFSRMLDEIDTEEHGRGRRLLTAVLVQAGKGGKSGPGFSACARHLGFQFDDERTFWKEELEALHEQARDKECPPA